MTVKVSLSFGFTIRHCESKTQYVQTFQAVMFLLNMEYDRMHFDTAMTESNGLYNIHIRIFSFLSIHITLTKNIYMLVQQ